jgi:hypothetical protein
MARGYYKTADGRWSRAGNIRESHKNDPFASSRRFGTSKEFPRGEWTQKTAENRIKLGSEVTYNDKGKMVTETLTRENRDRIFNTLTANEPTSKLFNTLVNAGKNSGEKEFRGTTKVYRGTTDNPKITSRGSQRGKGGEIKESLEKAVKDSGKGVKGTVKGTESTSKGRIRESRTKGFNATPVKPRTPKNK